MTEEELNKISSICVDILYSKIKSKIEKKINDLIYFNTTLKIKDNDKDRIEFLKKKENIFYNAKTKKQIKGISTIKDMLANVKKYKKDKNSRLYATEGQWFFLKREVLTEEKMNGIKYNVRCGSTFISSIIYNYYQTKPTKKTLEKRKKCNKKIKKKIYKKQNFKCAICEKIYKIEDLEVDHVKPLSLGGKNKITNYQLLCKHCNAIKYNKF